MTDRSSAAARPVRSAGGAVLIGVDVGGTFTDVVMIESASGRTMSAKVPTTPEDQSIGFVNGILKILADNGADGSAVSQVLHGTTVATNVILEGKGAAAILITSRGFRHVLEIGRHDIPRKANMFSWVKPARPVHPKDIFEIASRTEPDGSELHAVDPDEVRALARKLRALGRREIAVCLMHSYANPAHERQVRDLVLEVVPDALVSISSEILPVFREYERAMVTILNIYVMPAVASYVTRLEQRMLDCGITAPLLLMKSSGGVTGAETVRRAPVQTALSGPAAGVIGATQVGIAAGFENMVTIDIGGTSADVALIRAGRHGVTNRGRISNWPLHTPMIDITTIGAGGGSIARVSPGGGLMVGPDSAGAAPGPACYGRGGVEPTVTDANLVLGRVCSSLLDGSFALDRQAAREAIRMRVAEPLGISVERAAEGILEVVNNAMVGAIRQVSVERGHDPRDFALLAFGGAGPMHGGSMARLLGMRTIIVPPAPGVLAAFGLLVADIRTDLSRTCFEPPPDYDIARIQGIFAEVDGQAMAWLAAEGVPADHRETGWQASFRYAHQGFELTVPWSGKVATEQALHATIAEFHALHQQLYTFAQTDTPVELVTLHVTAIGRLRRPQATSAPVAQASLRPAPVARETMIVDGIGHDSPVYKRSHLAVGAVLHGPAIVLQLDSTTTLLPGQVARVALSGALIITET